MVNRSGLDNVLSSAQELASAGAVDLSLKTGVPIGECIQHANAGFLQQVATAVGSLQTLEMMAAADASRERVLPDEVIEEEEGVE